MTAKKNTAPATPPRTRKVRLRKNAPSASDATEAPADAKVVPTQAKETPAEPSVAEQSTETPAEPTAESSASVSPTPAEEATAATTDSSPEPTAPANQLSALDAAAKVLGETGQAMSCAELITAMAAQRYWSSPKGRTPAGTLYSAVLREMQTKGDQARFRKTARGKFALRETV